MSKKRGEHVNRYNNKYMIHNLYFLLEQCSRSYFYTHNEFLKNFNNYYRTLNKLYIKYEYRNNYSFNWKFTFSNNHFTRPDE